MAITIYLMKRNSYELQSNNLSICYEKAVFVMTIWLIVNYLLKFHLFCINQTKKVILSEYHCIHSILKRKIDSGKNVSVFFQKLIQSEFFE